MTVVSGYTEREGEHLSLFLENKTFPEDRVQIFVRVSIVCMGNRRTVLHLFKASFLY